ncbi:hypothetical protein HPB47_026483 [Ixodes persulcatus]|uniref:Uncharacterized protein n=1 Tax=Ixodes persulcatus TaxID=34615 RepID=A0AC60Q115_IXOPE|nr:hypothetical protein HPB47_026483 [Ixodes persulcatus]
MGADDIGPEGMGPEGIGPDVMGGGGVPTCDGGGGIPQLPTECTAEPGADPVQLPTAKRGGEKEVTTPITHFSDADQHH